MMRSMTAALVAAATLGAIALQPTTASAIPMIDRAPAALAQGAAAANVEHVRVVCGPFGCHWRPNYYRPYPVYGYGYGRGYGRGYGYGYGGRRHHPHYGYRHHGYRW